MGRRGFNDNASESRDNEKATLQDKEVPSLWAGRGAAGDGHLFPGRSGLRLPVSVRGVRMVISDQRSEITINDQDLISGVPSTAPRLLARLLAAA